MGAMRKLLLAIAIAAALCGAGDASAQLKMRNFGGGQLIKPPILSIKPGPGMKMIPPSMALNRAMNMVPQSQALGVKLQGSHYIIKLKQGNSVKQVHVDAATGDVSQ
jgi:uncharacterized membrane protein YkoI